MSIITADMICSLWPHGDLRVPGLRQGIIDTCDQWLTHYGCGEPLVVAHFFSQISHECGAGVEMVENLNYRTEQLLSQWPSHFTREQAVADAHNPRAIGNRAYGARMGNRGIDTDDGWNYRGRGGSQTTGRGAYEALGKQVGLDLVTNPDFVNDPKYFMQCSVGDFVMCGCLPHAKANDVVAVTRALNGGLIGLAEREQWLAKWKRALGVH